jgi:hypothetical protein
MGYAFKFISGKYQGGEFPLADGAEVIIGRGNDLDLVLAEDMVSRKHAKIVANGGSLSITDLGSTNGTFVNGEKVKRADLHLNDRVLIGTSILKIIDDKELRQNVGADRDAIREGMQKLAERTADAATMSGDLEEVPLPDLLQLFATNKKSGVLSISGSHRGKVYIKQGQLTYAVIGGQPPMSPMKAICRMMAWDEGSFELEPFEEGLEFPETFEESTESILIEALRQHDEVKRLLPELPPLDSHVTLCVPMVPKLSSLKPPELETLQLAINHGNLQAVVDKTPGPDHEALVNLHKLVTKGYLEVE